MRGEGIAQVLAFKLLKFLIQNWGASKKALGLLYPLVFAVKPCPLGLLLGNLESSNPGPATQQTFPGEGSLVKCAWPCLFWQDV